MKSVWLHSILSNRSHLPQSIAPHIIHLAWEADRSIPVALMDSIRPYINWQTTIEYLKDPPIEYAEKIQEPYDFYAEYERIYAKAKSDTYANEYAFGHDLYIAFQRAHDGHFVSSPNGGKHSQDIHRLTSITRLR